MNFYCDISLVQWESVTLHNNPNVCWKKWQTLYLEVLDRHAPFRHIRNRAKSLPWITKNIKSKMRSRDFLKKQAVKNNFHLQWNRYKKTRNEVQMVIRGAKKGKNFKTNNITELLIGNLPTSDDNLIAETFNEYFVTIGSKLAHETNGDCWEETNSLIQTITPGARTPSLSFLKLVKTQLFLSCANLKRRSLPVSI